MFIYHFNRLVHKKILWGIFAFIIAIAFVFSGASCFQDPQQDQTAGTIDGKPVTLATREVVAMAIRGIGSNRDTETSAAVVERRVWDQLAAVHTAQKNGFTSTEAEIQDALKEIPEFQGANGFDMMRYRQILMRQEMTPSIFEKFVGHQLNMQKVASLVETAAWISPMEMQDELAGMTDRFTVQVAMVSNRFDKVEMRLAEADYKKYYEENKASFGLPDRVSVRFITIPASNYLASVTVPEDDLLGYYDSHMDTYRRTTTNDLSETIPFAEVRDSILAELKLVEALHCAETNLSVNLLARVDQLGTNALAIFAEELKQSVKFSPLFSLTETLYWTEASTDFANAAFELDPERSDTRFDIVNGKTEVYLMEFKQRSPEHVPAFETVQAEVKVRAQEKARSEAYESYTKELQSDLRKLLEAGKTFAAAAKEKGLPVTTNITFAVNEMQSQPTFENGYSIAYGARNLKKGELSDAVPSSPSESLLIYVQDRKPGDMLAAEMMRSQIRTAIARRRGNSLFTDWLMWNRTIVKATPRIPLEDDEPQPAEIADPKEAASTSAK